MATYKKQTKTVERPGFFSFPGRFVNINNISDIQATENPKKYLVTLVDGRSFEISNEDRASFINVQKVTRTRVK